MARVLIHYTGMDAPGTNERKMAPVVVKGAGSGVGNRGRVIGSG